MATSQQWRHASLMVAATLVVLFIGSAAGTFCPPGFLDCDPYKFGCETFIKYDVNNCGKCRNQCKQVPNAVTKCYDGECGEPECEKGWANCDKNWDNGCETNVYNEIYNCGKCGYQCKQVPNAVTKCYDGKCGEPECENGWANCDKNWDNGCETNVYNDIYNCGKCGYQCKQVPNAVTKCYDGKCGEPECEKGWANCDKNWDNGCETNVYNDIYNCGKCGYQCKQVPNAVTKCYDGKCGEPECEKGWANCDKNWDNGCETNVYNDIYNCGKCGYKCKVTLEGGEATCSYGTCGQQCKKGTKYDEEKKCCVPSY